MGRVLMSGIVLTLAEPFPIKPVFADNTWGDIVKACQKNRVPESWAVGDSKQMVINGTSYQIDIIGKNHDSYVDVEGTAPLTFQMHDLYSETVAMGSSTATGWAGSIARSSKLPEILKLMPAEVRDGIRKVRKQYFSSYTSTIVLNIADDLFLLSELEAFGEATYGYQGIGEGVQYDYYKAGNSTVKKLNGTDTWQWLRTPYSRSQYCIISSDGSDAHTSCDYTLGIAFAFCF